MGVLPRFVPGIITPGWFATHFTWRCSHISSIG